MFLEANRFLLLCFIVGVSIERNLFLCDDLGRLELFWG